MAGIFASGRAHPAVQPKANLDALTYPTIRRQAAKIGTPQPGDNCQPSANSGLPAITVPAGWTSDGLPAGIELLGRPWADGDLLGWAYDYEQATRHRRAPVLPEAAGPREPQER